MLETSLCFMRWTNNALILSLQVPKEDPHVSICGDEVQGQWNNCYYNNHPSTVWISYFMRHIIWLGSLFWFFFFFLLHKLISFDNTNFSSSEKSPTFHLTFEFISKLCCFWNSPLLNFWEVILHGYFFVMQKLLFSLEFQGLSKVHLTTLSNSWTFW